MWLTGFSLETIRLGLKNLRLHKLRSLLTALGIIFGVGAVICMLSISEGASASEMELIRLLGTQNIIVKSVKPDRGSAISESNTFILRYGVTRKDMAVIKATVPHISRLVPLREVAYEVSYADQRLGATVVGADPAFFEVVAVPADLGRFICPYDAESRTKVCVIGDAVRKRLFTFEDPLGKTLTVHNRTSGAIPFQVVGVLKPVLTAGAPARGLGERDLNHDVFIPLATADARYGDTIFTVRSGSREAQTVECSDLYVEVDDMDRVLPVSRMISRIMEYYHEKKDYEIKVPLERLQLAQKEKHNRQITLGAIAGVSLLVGGIGIMNIMLASVTERTREIGIRRALGARQRHIVAQFLVETVVLSTAGGLLGIILGWGGAWVITQSVGWPTIIQAWTVLVSFGLSVMVGIFFGMYPAVSAAKLDPIQALRYE